MHGGCRCFAAGLPKFEHFGSITRQPYHEQLGSSANLLQELRARATDSTCGLAPWADAHEQASKKLAALLGGRTVEVSQQSSLRMRDTRLSSDAMHRKILDRIDAMVNLNGKDFAGGFFAEYNTHATEYKNKLAQHLGRVKKSEELKTKNQDQV
jgi:kynureninase